MIDLRPIEERYTGRRLRIEMSTLWGLVAGVVGSGLRRTDL